MADAAPEMEAGAADSLEREAKMPPELLQRVGASIGELVLRKPPDAFVGVELRRVAGEAKEMEPGEGTAHGTDRVSLVDRAAIPEQDDGSSEMAEQMAQEGADLGVLDVLRVEAVVQTETTAAGTHGDARDHGDPIVPLVVVKKRGLSARRPGLADTRNQEEARLVDEDEMGTQPRGFFLMRGHSSRFHRSIASSFRSKARRSGFWWLKPSAWSSRPT